MNITPLKDWIVCKPYRRPTVKRVIETPDGYQEDDFNTVEIVEISEELRKDGNWKSLSTGTILILKPGFGNGMIVDDKVMIRFEWVVGILEIPKKKKK